MVRLYGKAPYEAVLVHGGSGAIGSLKGFAEELIEELFCQIKIHCTSKVSLIGHSWGAWLVALFAEKYPEIVKNVILIGCAPLEDNYCLENREKHRADRTDSEMHNKVWSEAAKLRSSGKLLTSSQNIKSKIYLIQGESDPHPVNGVTIPLQENGVQCETYVLEKCGHSPFMEKYVKDEFYKILIRAIGEKNNDRAN